MKRMIDGAATYLEEKRLYQEIKHSLGLLITHVTQKNNYADKISELIYKLVLNVEC